MMTEWPEFWWSSITGPRNLCNAVARALHNKSSVCLFVPDDLPWRYEMRACIETGMHQFPEMESFCVEFIDVEDECADITDVGRYLLERYALPAVAAGYRGRETMQKYMLDKQVLANRVFWIKGMNPGQERLWLQFCRDYSAINDSDGRFVLEARWSDKENERRNLTVIRYDDNVRPYDLTLFNSIYLTREKEANSPIWQQYTATMCTLLCSTDAETSQTLLERCDFTSEEPIAGLQAIVDDGMYPRRGESNSQHILNLIRQENTAVIDNQIWKAQLQVLFPLIEIERVSFVEKYRERLQEAISEKYYDYRYGYSQLVYQFGDKIDSPDDVELGTIYRMTKLKRAADESQYLLYIPEEQSRSRIELLHRVRNSLAHGENCPIEQVAEFVNGHPFTWK